MDNKMIGMCGAYCGDCEWKERTGCQGCQASQSHMFWGQCQVAKCAIENGHTHCGTCSELPCGKLTDAFNNPEHGDNGERLANLKGWAKGEATYLKLRPLDSDKKNS